MKPAHPEGEPRQDCQWTEALSIEDGVRTWVNRDRNQPLRAIFPRQCIGEQNVALNKHTPVSLAHSFETVLLTAFD